MNVDGVTEQWRLKWAGPVKPFCGPSDMAWAATCPCIGFAYGEQGKLSLERDRPGSPREQLDLSALFAGFELDGAESGNAVLPRWPRKESDPDENSADQVSARRLEVQIMRRPAVEVMEMQDFLHEGRKTTFLLHVGNLPCGKEMMMLVGTSRANPHLHAFATVAHPNRPLVLQSGEWRALLSATAPVTVTDWACGDHASETSTEKTIAARNGVLEVHTREYACRADGSRGALLRSEEE